MPIGDWTGLGISPYDIGEIKNPQKKKAKMILKIFIPLENPKDVKKWDEVVPKIEKVLKEYSMNDIRCIIDYKVKVKRETKELSAEETDRLRYRGVTQEGYNFEISSR